jgi:hypothetical protein
MRAWPLHVVFATILVGSLAAKEQAAEVLDVDNATLQTAVTRIAQSQGLDFRGDAKVAGYIPALAFEAPGCSGPVLVVVRVVFDEESFMHFAREQGDVLRYVYIDRAWEKPDRLALFLERMKYAALAIFGLTRYVPSGHMLLVESPPQCKAADAIDWRDVWNRDYVRATRAAIEATTR